MNELITSYSRLSASELITFTSQVLAKMGELPASGDFADVVPTVAELGALKTAYEAELAKETSVSVTVKRKTARDNLSDGLSRMATSCMVIANGDMDMLSNTGFQFRKVPEHSHEVPAAPADLRLKNGAGGGEIVARVKPAAHSHSYELQTTADPVAGPWVPHGTFTNSQSMTVTGLTPLTLAFVRARGVGANGPGAWSDVAEIVVN